MAPVISPSHQLRLISRPVTAVNVMMEMNRNTMPKPANRLIDPRSVVARDSSWPDCHSSWNAGSSRCRCAYRSSLIVLLHVGDRVALDPAADQAERGGRGAEPIASRPSGSSRPRSWWAMAPSMTALVTSGMAMSAASTTRAAAIMTMSWLRYGRR